jgi:adenine-specific DNA-methyltransferase
MYERARHAASKTNDYVFHQLIPYIGNKRKLLRLIGDAIKATGADPKAATFLDLFSGSGVVARFAKKRGFRVVANDWEPYAEAINGSYIAQNAAPVFGRGKTYKKIIGELNNLPPLEGWVTQHLCPESDEHYDIERDRLFYTRVNGMRLDAMREKIQTWTTDGTIDKRQAASLLAPLLYQACYTSNTSGVFKGFHNGWGGQTRTALYRIKSRLTLAPAIFFDNCRKNEVFRNDATKLARSYAIKGPSIAYIDPPYNQHPYGSNYHVLNSIALWDKPHLTPKIEGRNKAAIRTDWRTERRSKYNSKHEALAAYEELLDAVSADWILTSYSTDGNMTLENLVRAACRAGATTVLTQGYKRYRVSSQRFSEKPLNVEFVLVTQKGVRGGETASAIAHKIRAQEQEVLKQYQET